MKDYSFAHAIRRLARAATALAVAVTVLATLSISPARAQDRPRYAGPQSADARTYDDSNGNGSAPFPGTYRSPSRRRADVLTVILPALGGAILGGIIGGRRGVAIGAGAGAGVGGGVIYYRRHRRRPAYPGPFPSSPLSNRP